MPLPNTITTSTDCPSAMILLDTGYLIAVGDARDALHPRAVKWSETIAERLLVTEHVLIEAVNHFSTPANRGCAHKLMEWVLADAGVEIVWADRALFESGLRLHRARADKAWSLTDCISFFLMQERGIPAALAYDIHFEQAGFEALLRRDPPNRI